MTKKAENEEEQPAVTTEKQNKKEPEVKIPETKTTELKEVNEADVSVPNEGDEGKKKKKKGVKEETKEKGNIILASFFSK